MKINKGLPRSASENELVAIDIEMYGMEQDKLHRPTGTFACITAAYSNKEVYQLKSRGHVQEFLDRLEQGRWVLQNGLFDIRHLRRWATIEQRPIWDTMLVELALFGGYYDSFGLSALSRRWLGKKLGKNIREQFATAHKMTKEMDQYAAKDASVTLTVREKQAEYIEKEQLGMRHYWEIDELALWAVLDMKPVAIDVDLWLQLAEEHALKSEAIKEQLGFNPGSSKQTLNALTSALGKAPKNTRANTLDRLKEELIDRGRTKGIELITAIQDYRTYKKASSSYGAKWTEKYVEEGNLIYPAWRVTGTRTGRTACRDPNLQNIPIRKMPVFRSAIIRSQNGGRLLVSDVHQQEPCLAAYLSQDDRLLDAVESGDVYIPVAQALFHVPPSRVTKSQRARAKSIFLGTCYGLSPYGLAYNEGIPTAEAEMFMVSFFDQFRGFANWRNRVMMRAERHEQVVTTVGRPIWINKYNEQWQRNAVNAPIQGSAADMSKLAMVLIHQKCKEQGLEYCVNLMVHDEIVLDIPPGMMKQYRKIVKEAWREAGNQVMPGMPVIVDIGTGVNWSCKL